MWTQEKQSPSVSAFSFPFPVSGILGFFWISNCPKPARLSDNSACFNVRNHRISPGSQLRCHFLHFLPSLGRLRSFGNFGCQHFLKSKYSKQKSEIPSVRFHLVLPQKENESQQKYGDCVGGLYKYIIIDVSLSSKSSVISTSFEMSWTGGHPQLLRWFCRAARTSALDSTRIRTSGRLAGCDGFRKKTCKGQQCATVQWLARLFKYCVCIYEWYRYRDYRVVCAIHNICNHLHIYVAYLRHGDSSQVPKKLCCEVSFAMSDTHFESKKHWKGWLPLLPTLWFHWSILIRAQEVNICHGTCMAQSSLSKQMYGDIWGTYGYGTSYFHQVFSHISSPPNSWFLNASKMRLESSCFTTAACKSFSSSDWLALEHLNGCELSGMDDSVALTLLTYSDWFPFDIIHTPWPESLVSGFPAEAHIDKDRNSWILLQNRRNFI